MFYSHQSTCIKTIFEESAKITLNNQINTRSIMQVLTNDLEVALLVGKRV